MYLVINKWPDTEGEDAVLTGQLVFWRGLGTPAIDALKSHLCLIDANLCEGLRL